MGDPHALAEVAPLRAALGLSLNLAPDGEPITLVGAGAMAFALDEPDANPLALFYGRGDPRPALEVGAFYTGRPDLTKACSVGASPSWAISLS